jgi:hypothetical protein
MVLRTTSIMGGQKVNIRIIVLNNFLYSKKIRALRIPKLKLKIHYLF